nr:gamma-glutamylcyclotransferase family protein [Hyphomonas sp. Mor2]
MTVNGRVSSGDLFVFYGLLKQGATGMPAHIDLEKAGAFLGPCWFRGALYDLGGFPGVVDGDGLCHGVRYRLDDASLIEALDEFEDVVPDDPDASLYLRKKVPLIDASGTESGEQAWIYWYNRPTDSFTRLADDDWPLDRGRVRKTGT